MKVSYEVSPIVKAIYELHISPAEKKKLLAENETFDKAGRSIRVQCYIPVEAFIILKAFGAFKGSRTAFFSDLASDYIEKRAIELAIMPSVLKHMKGAV